MASAITATTTASPSNGTTRCRSTLGGPPARRIQKQPITAACSSPNAVSAPTFTTDDNCSSPSSLRAAHTAATSVTRAAPSSALRGTPLPASTFDIAPGSRRSRAIANSSRAAAACPASAANAAPTALLTATRSRSQPPTAASTVA